MGAWAITVPCPACGAKAGKPCRSIAPKGWHDVGVYPGDVIKGIHKARVQARTEPRVLREQDGERQYGRMVAAFTVWCGTCRTEQTVQAAGVLPAGKKLRELGWRKGPVHGWQCAGCYRSHVCFRCKPRSDCKRRGIM